MPSLPTVVERLLRPVRQLNPLITFGDYWITHFPVDINQYKKRTNWNHPLRRRNRTLFSTTSISSNSTHNHENGTVHHRYQHDNQYHPDHSHRTTTTTTTTTSTTTTAIVPTAATTVEWRNVLDIDHTNWRDLYYLNRILYENPYDDNNIHITSSSSSSSSLFDDTQYDTTRFWWTPLDDRDIDLDTQSRSIISTLQLLYSITGGQEGYSIIGSTITTIEDPIILDSSTNDDVLALNRDNNALQLLTITTTEQCNQLLQQFRDRIVVASATLKVDLDTGISSTSNNDKIRKIHLHRLSELMKRADAIVQLMQLFQGDEEEEENDDTINSDIGDDGKNNNDQHRKSPLLQRKKRRLAHPPPKPDRITYNLLKDMLSKIISIPIFLAESSDLLYPSKPLRRTAGRRRPGNGQQLPVTGYNQRETITSVTDRLIDIVEGTRFPLSYINWNAMLLAYQAYADNCMRRLVATSSSSSSSATTSYSSHAVRRDRDRAAVDAHTAPDDDDNNDPAVLYDNWQRTITDATKLMYLMLHQQQQQQQRVVESKTYDLFIRILFVRTFREQVGIHYDSARMEQVDRYITNGQIYAATIAIKFWQDFIAGTVKKNDDPNRFHTTHPDSSQSPFDSRFYKSFLKIIRGLPYTLLDENSHPPTTTSHNIDVDVHRNNQLVRLRREYFRECFQHACYYGQVDKLLIKEMVMNTHHAELLRLLFGPHHYLATRHCHNANDHADAILRECIPKEWSANVH